MAAALLKMCRRGQSFFFSEEPDFLRRAIHTSVWWDLNSCKVPRRRDLSSIAGDITDALAKRNYDAPVTFSVYFDWARYSFYKDSEALSKRGIKVIDAPFSRTYTCISHALNWAIFVLAGSRSSICGQETSLGSKMILHDIWYWTKDHPAPANCLIISGHGELAFALHQLRMGGYTILLAKPQTRKALGTMEAAAKTVWQWTSLLAGGPPEGDESIANSS